MNIAHRKYYTRHVMDRVNQIQLAVIGIGIAILAINYLGLMTAEIDVLSSPPFWQRVILLLLVILFSSYTALVYSAYLIRVDDPETSHIKGGHPVRILTLFLLDIFQATVTACMFGVLFIPDAVQLLSSPPCSEQLISQQCLGLPELAIEMIFLLGAAWHVLVTAWYVVADGFRKPDVRNHCCFASIYVLLALASFFFDWFNPWIAAASFSVVLISLFVVQGRRWLEE